MLGFVSFNSLFDGVVHLQGRCASSGISPCWTASLQSHILDRVYSGELASPETWVAVHVCLTPFSLTCIVSVCIVREDSGPEYTTPACCLPQHPPLQNRRQHLQFNRNHPAHKDHEL